MLTRVGQSWTWGKNNLQPNDQMLVLQVTWMFSDPASVLEGPSGFAVELPEEEQRSQTGAVSVRNLFLIAVRYGMLLWQAIQKTYLCIYIYRYKYICRFSCIDCAYWLSIMKVLDIWYLQPQTPVVLGCFFSGCLAAMAVIGASTTRDFNSTLRKPTEKAVPSQKNIEQTITNKLLRTWKPMETQHLFV